jgi:magnesium chelatase family protein
MSGTESLARVACRAQLGLAAPPVLVEVHVGAGLPSLGVVGLPATEVKESRDRVRSALATSGFELPAGRITVNLAPADLPKDGGRFDLAIAVGILLASGQLRVAAAAKSVIADERVAHSPVRCEFLGELGLGGELRPVQGALVAARAALAAGNSMILPLANLQELRLLGDPELYVAPDLASVVRFLASGEGLPRAVDVIDDVAVQARTPAARASVSVSAPALSLADVCGQHQAKRALVVAAAGGHSLLFVGPPGCGKSMLARRLPGLLPPPDSEEALEIATIASIASRSVPAAVPDASNVRAAQARRPFRSPHHTASSGAVIGGGPRARPGEITLAHRGVLFLDELPEFRRDVLEALREPLEVGAVCISRAGLQAEYPARFLLVAAMNPCPCGYLGDRERACRCTPAQLANYRARISGPLLDRIDLRIALESVSEGELAALAPRIPVAPAGDVDVAAALPADEGEDASAARTIAAARARQLARCGRLNAQLEAPDLARHARTTPAARTLLANAKRKLMMSMRAEHRVLRVARTLADMEGEETLEPRHVAEAIQLRRALDESAD